MQSMDFNTDRINAALNSAHLLPIEFIVRRNGIEFIHVEPWGLDFELRDDATSRVLLFSELPGDIRFAIRGRDILIDTAGMDLVYTERHVNELTHQSKSMDCEFVIANEREMPIEVQVPKRSLRLQPGDKATCRISGPLRWLQLLDASPSTLRIGFAVEDSHAQSIPSEFEVL